MNLVKDIQFNMRTNRKTSHNIPICSGAFRVLQETSWKDVRGPTQTSTKSASWKDLVSDPRTSSSDTNCHDPIYFTIR